MGGWIKIHREIRDHWIYQDPLRFWWWIDMLFLASYKDNKVLVKSQLVEVKRGQFIGSISFFTKRWNISKDRVISFLRLLESEGMIYKASDKNLTLITICNYESYQDASDNQPDNLSDSLSNNLSDNHLDITKESKESKEIYSLSSSAHTHEESEYIRRYREEGMWMDVAMILHKPVPECEQLFDRWIVEFQHNGDTHSTYTDFKKHFIQWARITIQKETKNGNNRQDYSRRGRAEVPTDISVDF